MMDALMECVNWTSISVCLSAIIYFYFKHKFNYWTKRGIKSPTPIPWFGTSLYPLFMPKPELELTLHRRLGKLYGLYGGFLGTQPTLVCGHPEAIKQVTIKHFDLFVNRARPATWRSIRFRALTYLRDEEWRNMRKILAPTFTSYKLKKMYELMKKCTSNLKNNIEDQVNQEIDLKKIFSVFTVDVISTCCFSLDLKDYRHPDSPILLSARKFFEVSRLKMLFYMSIPKQFLRLINFDINDTTSIDFFAKFATEIIDRRREIVNRDLSRMPNDFLQTLIDAAAEFNDRKGSSKTVGGNIPHQKQQQQHQDVTTSNMDEEREQKQQQQQQVSDNPKEIDEQQLGDLEILAQAMLFFAVGHETTATLLSSCGLFLALNPELQDRLYDEVHEAFVQDKGEVKYERLMELKYLDAFISEALRFFTPTLSFDREASEDVEIEVDGLKLVIPKGMTVSIPFHAVHHDPDNFHDPERFDPERFMSPNKDNIKPHTFIPFGSGPRHCLASRFSIIEAKLALATLVNKFRFVQSQGTTWPPKYRHHYMLLQMQWPKIRFVDRKLESLSESGNRPQMAA